MTTAPVTGEWRLTKARVALPRLLWAELRWIFRRPRTLVVLGLLAVIPVIIGIALSFADGGPTGDADPPVFVTAASSALALPIGALTVLLGLLLPLTVTKAAGDALAGEQANGTLRGWLLAPVGKGRLLLVKAFGVAVVGLVAAGLVGTTGFLTGLISNGTDGLFTLSGTTLPLLDALGRVAIAVGWVTVQLWALGAVALAISACTEHPMLVLATVLGGVIVSQVLLVFESLDWLHPFLLPASWDALINLVRDPIWWDGLGEGVLRAACYLAIGLSLAYARLVTSDG
ncbi:ABC transporter permease [Haloechinothrix halophila]|uniref:ABC transporter permease n=1 Tax=Haloechinothrix halophila TaxID=1069073 RepID=UPI00055822EA|nr:ABC transporter permease subunit [Haloechinothrix halophila]